MAPRIQLEEVIFEFVRVGNVVRVNAVDPVTATEVTIVGSPSVSTEHLKRVAKRKLEYVLAKKPQSRGGGDG
jgi:hypothetical protein